MVALASGWRSFLVPAVIVVAINLLFVYFRRRFPVQKSRTGMSEKPVSGVWTIASACVFIASIAAVAFGVAIAGRFLNRYWADPSGSARFVLTPTAVWWYLYSGFLGLCSAYVVAKPVLRSLMGRDRFEQWALQGDRKAGFSSGRALNVLGLVIMLPYTVFFLPSLVCHTRFSTTEIGIQTYPQMKEARYRYSDVHRIVLVDGYKLRSGAFERDPRIVIEFSGGRRWSSRDSFRDPEEINSNLVTFLLEKTNLPLQSAETIEQVRRIASE
jgi:hypothetical protein